MIAPGGRGPRCLSGPLHFSGGSLHLILTRVFLSPVSGSSKVAMTPSIATFSLPQLGHLIFSGFPPPPPPAPPPLPPPPIIPHLPSIFRRGHLVVIGGLSIFF